MFKSIKYFFLKFKKSKQNVHDERFNFIIYPELILISIYITLILFAYFTNDLHFFGNKTNSFFDFWSFIHIFSGATLSYTAFRLRDFNISNPILFIMFISLQWEILEMYIEQGAIFSTVSFWFGGSENFFNRFLSDQLCILLGFLFVKLKPQLYFPFMFLTIIFVLFHIYIGSSTYLI